MKKPGILIAGGLVVAFLVFAAWIVGTRVGDVPDPLAGETREVLESSAGSSGLPVHSNGMPEFEGIVAWLNSDALTQEELRGKVVLIDFWTYSCINCIRTLPYVTSWYDTYEDEGFVVIGVHTPEFAFEKERRNVEEAVRRHGIRYPVALDNGYETWDNYHNRYWPAHYLFDAQGRLRYFHFGEGKYDVTESRIRALLEEAGRTPDESMTEIAPGPDFSRIGTPETYLGYGRMEYLGSPERVLRDEARTYTSADEPVLNRFYYEGTWRVERERGVLAEAPGAIVYRYKAASANLVLSPPDGGTARVRVFVDGQETKVITVTEETLYVLHETPGVYAEHVLRLEFLDAGTAAYAFTFG